MGFEVLGSNASTALVRLAALACGFADPTGFYVPSDSLAHNRACIYRDSECSAADAWAEREENDTVVLYYFFCEDYPNGSWEFEVISRTPFQRFDSPREAMAWFDANVCSGY